MSHDRISEASRWRTCVHEAGHVALVLLTDTELIRAIAYRHHSTASAHHGTYGWTFHMPAASEARNALIEGAGIVAEALFTDASPRVIIRCTSDRLPEDGEARSLCRDFLASQKPGVLRVASVLREARGFAPSAVLARAFGDRS